MHDKKISVVLCEDSEIVRAGMAFALEKEGMFDIVGVAADGLVAVSKVVELCPDVVLMDVLMPEMGGIEATREIKRLRPETKVLMLTSSSEQKVVDAALDSGADGYCLKESMVPSILQAIHATACGAAWLDKGVSGHVLRRSAAATVTASAKTKDSGTGHRFKLSGRECEVLELVVEGNSNKQIADILIISPETVKSHVRHIMEKMQVTGRTQLAVKAIRN
jgi:two-component system response regulator DegU